MESTDLAGVLDFLRAAEQLKVKTRSAFTSDGRAESIAEHTWRLCLMAMVLRPTFPDVDFTRVMTMCLVHDLGEAIGGDVSAPEQARRLSEDPLAAKSSREREDLSTLVAPLPASMRAEICGLWDEYEAATTPEARLCKALDKLETILVEQPDNCRKGCPACSRVCPENAIMFPQHKTPAIAGSPEVGASLKIYLSELFGAPEQNKSAAEIAIAERDEQLIMAGRAAVGEAVGIKRTESSPPRPKDELDRLIDQLDAFDL